MNTQETLNRTNFTLYEARAIVEIVRPGFEHSTLGLTEAVEHGLEDGLADEWDIDSESLRAKLRDLAPGRRSPSSMPAWSTGHGLRLRSGPGRS